MVYDVDVDDSVGAQGEENEAEEDGAGQWCMRNLIELEPTSAAAMLLLDAPATRRAQKASMSSVDPESLVLFDVMQRREMGLGVPWKKEQPVESTGTDNTISPE